MDKSKLYISMCQQATLLQKLKTQHDPGDFVAGRDVVMVVNGYCLNEQQNEYRTIHNIDDTFVELWFAEGDEEIVWLPRADQLLAILLKHNSHLPDIEKTTMEVVFHFEGGEVIGLTDGDGDKAITFEQYLLMNVMYLQLGFKWVWDDEQNQLGHWQN